jgi:hypothetical protein
VAGEAEYEGVITIRNAESGGVGILVGLVGFWRRR